MLPCLGTTKYSKPDPHCHLKRKTIDAMQHVVKKQISNSNKLIVFKEGKCPLLGLQKKFNMRCIITNIYFGQLNASQFMFFCSISKLISDPCPRFVWKFLRNGVMLLSVKGNEGYVKAVFCNNSLTYHISQLLLSFRNALCD